MLLDAGVHQGLITMSSDSNGSSPIFDDRGKLVAMGIGSIATLWEETRDVIVQEEVPVEVAVRIVTRNVARVLKLGQKGAIREGMDADLFLADEQFQIRHVFAKGRQVVQDGNPIVFGTFEHADRVPGSPGAKAETGKVDKGRGRANISPNEDDPDDFQTRQNAKNAAAAVTATNVRASNGGERRFTARNREEVLGSQASHFHPRLNGRRPDVG